MINAYVYRIVNKKTNQFYYGYRYKNQRLGIRPNNDLWIKYFTSSQRIKKEIKEHGSDVFVAEIVYENSDSIECWRQEQIYIRDAWNDPLLLNGKYHDPESMIEVYRRVNLLTDKARAKMSAAGRGRSKSLEHRQKIARSNTGKIGSLQKREKISRARKGKPPSNKGVTPPKYQCTHCHAIVSKANLNRWHGDQCKQIDPVGHLHRTLHVASINKKSG
jgi:hypothetical protein